MDELDAIAAIRTKWASRYGPTPQDVATLLTALDALTADRDALRAASFAAWRAYDEDTVPHSPALQAAFRALYAVLGARP